VHTLPRRGLFALGGAAALVLTGCGTQQAGPSGDPKATVTVSHAKGELEVPANPQRTVVFDTVTLDTMSALGLVPAGCPEGVAFPQRLADHLADVPGMGSLFEPDLEAVNGADPELIIVGGRSAKAYDALAKIGVPVLDMTMPDGDPVEGLKQRTTALGTVFGKESEVEEQLAAIDASIEDVRGRAEAAGKGLIIMVSGGKLTGYGSGSRFGFIHDTLGLAEAGPEMEHEGHHGEQISFEFIAQHDPDVIFVIDRDAAIGEEGAKAAMQVLDTPLVMDTKAGRNGGIIELDGPTWYIVGNGLATLPAMIDQVEPAFSAS